MTAFAHYRDRFRNIHFDRQDGIVVMRLHTGGQPLRWGFKDEHSVHAQLGEAFYQIGRDMDNRVLILTGTGDTFLTGIDDEDAHEGAWDAHFWDRMAQEGRDIFINYLDVPFPVISAVNGPATFHAELPTMADLVIASDTAVFADPHLAGMGIVPGDGAHVWWPMVLGPNRGRSFLISGEEIDAAEALRLGLVTEVVPKGRELERAREIALRLTKNKAMVLRNTRLALTQEIKRRLFNDLNYGFGLEGLAALS